jgi:hypothetical protein
VNGLYIYIYIYMCVCVYMYMYVTENTAETCQRYVFYFLLYLIFFCQSPSLFILLFSFHFFSYLFLLFFCSFLFIKPTFSLLFSYFCCLLAILSLSLFCYIFFPSPAFITCISITSYISFLCCSFALFFSERTLSSSF